MVLIIKILGVVSKGRFECEHLLSQKKKVNYYEIEQLANKVYILI